LGNKKALDKRSNSAKTTQTMKYEPEKGDSIYFAAQKAIKLARENNQEVEFVFNEIRLIASPLSYDVDIATIYNLQHEIRRLSR
jgi:hypothetical protein